MSSNLVDSGKRTEFSTGAMREISEETKGRCDLLPLDIVSDLVTAEDAVLYHIAKFVETSDPINLETAFFEFCCSRKWDTATAMLELSIHFADGVKKYSPNNWRKGIPIHSFLDSAIRHYFKWLRCDEDEPHDRAFLWNIVCCLWTLKNKPEMMDLDKDV